jgi:hypothetical protein
MTFVVVQADVLFAGEEPLSLMDLGRAQSVSCDCPILAGHGRTRASATRRAATNSRFQAGGSKAASPAADPTRTSHCAAVLPESSLPA